MKFLVMFHISVSLAALFFWVISLIMGIKNQLMWHTPIAKTYLVLLFLTAATGFVLGVHSLLHLELVHPGRAIGPQTIKITGSVVNTLAIIAVMMNGLACIKRQHFNYFTLFFNFFFLANMSWAGMLLFPRDPKGVLVVLLIWYPSIFLFIHWFFQNKQNYRPSLKLHVLFMTLTGSSLFNAFLGADGAKVLPIMWQNWTRTSELAVFANLVVPLFAYLLPLCLKFKVQNPNVCAKPWKII